MTTDLYSGKIDWDRIYRTFHRSIQIAKRVQLILPILFCLLLFVAAPADAEELADAVDDVIVAAEKNPTDPEAQKRAGWGYLILARDVGNGPAKVTFGTMAEHHLDIAAQLNPRDNETLALLAEAAVLNQSPYKAATVYEILVSRQSDPAEGKYLVPLHTCYQWLHDPWRGVSFYRDQLIRIPNWPQMKFLLSTLLLELDRKEALEILWELAGSPETPDGLKATVRAALKEES